MFFAVSTRSALSINEQRRPELTALLYFRHPQPTAYALLLCSHCGLPIIADYPLLAGAPDERKLFRHLFLACEEKAMHPVAVDRE